jgi:tetratricopeptide (TPR) repeat protein
MNPTHPLRAFTLMTALLLAFCSTAQRFEELQQQAHACFQKKDHPCAVKLLKKALKQEPNHPRAALAWSDIGTALRRMDKDREALEAYDKAVAMAPDDVGILANRATLKRKMKDLDGALADQNEVLRITPTNSNGYMERATTKGRMGDTAGEEADLVRAVEIDQKNFKAGVNLALLRKRAGRYEEALSDLNGIIERHPKEVIPYNNRADLIMTMGGDLQAALKDIEHALKLAPTYSNGYITRAEIRLAMGDKKKALEDLEQAVKLGEDQAEFQHLFDQCR